MQRAIASLVGCLIPFGKSRRKIRNWLRCSPMPFTGIAKLFNQIETSRSNENAKYNKKINVAFCFNLQLTKQAAVAITSLLYNSSRLCHYNIYCVVSNDVDTYSQKLLSDIVKKYDPESVIKFYIANNDYKNSCLGQWDISVYYRLMLPVILSKIDKVIYADVDVIFCRSLIVADKIKLGNNLIAGTPHGLGNDYINSGFLIMNLKAMRSENTYSKFIEISKAKEFPYPDQDVLHEVCRGKQILLGAKYNFIPAHFRGWPLEELSALPENLIMIHYTGIEKPWDFYHTLLWRIWRRYAKMTELF